MYDTCAYKKKLEESTSPLSYILNPMAYEHCSKCRVEFGLQGGPQVSHHPGNMIDLENDLRGATRPASHCPSKHYTPRCRNCRNCNEGLPCGCYHCKEKMRHMTPCQMPNYKQPMVPPPQFRMQRCPGYGGCQR